MSPAARDEIFNVTNGDAFRWEHMWPVIAGAFGVQAPLHSTAVNRPAGASRNQRD